MISLPFTIMYIPVRGITGLFDSVHLDTINPRIGFFLQL